ncbi:hypothetical protein POTOM_025190 [Populus tomentosa]|uniref:Uncharacterized protein n=1 Tax=Populus tomentosa TaxID=118781 RepID=A0A8X7ZNN9_POPTO|nr:hypothetical protein POTOM_025190 [Populus tomentosa]
MFEQFCEGVRCIAVEITAAESDIKEEKRKKGLYGLQNLTTWLLKKEQANVSLTTGSIFGIYGPGEQWLSDIDDDSIIQQRTPIFFGNSDEVDKLLQYLA